MKYDIYFHNDFDGRASAAVMLAFLRSRGDDIEHYVPVKYDIIPQWLDENFLKKNKLFKGKHNPAIIVDFPYHPQAAFWFDHHLRPFRKPGWDKKFKPDIFHQYDDGYPSACGLVYASLKKDFSWKPPAHLRELVKWLDILDYANYRSARQTIVMKEPAIQINNFIEMYSGDQKRTVWTVEYLSKKSLNDFADEPFIKRSVNTLRLGTKEALDFYRKKLRIDGGVMVIDLSGFRFGELAHFAPYYLHPKMLYAIRFHPFPGKPSLFHVNAGVNPWRRQENKKNIGELMKKYGGGGHMTVGGTEIKGRKTAERIVGEMVSFLNKNNGFKKDQ